MKETLRKNEAITLIALVITIIILLILAGITIAMLTGENGILARAKGAKTSTNNAETIERIQLAYQSAIVKGKGSYTKIDIEEELEDEFGSGYNVNDEDSEFWILSANGQSVTVPAGISDSASVHFTLNGRNCRATSEMTWSQWISSSYNTTDLFFNITEYGIDVSHEPGDEYGAPIFYDVETFGGDESEPDFPWHFVKSNEEIINGVEYEFGG